MAESIFKSKMLVDNLMQSLHDFQQGSVIPDRERDVIWDVTSGGDFINGMTLDTFLARAEKILIESEHVYRFEDTIVFEVGEAPYQALLLLALQRKAEPNAAGLLTNLFGVGVHNKDSAAQSTVPVKLVGALLADEDLWRKSPIIRVHAQRAVYDATFTLRGPGYYAEQGILVHGPDIIPAQLSPVTSTPGASIDRLLPFIKRLLKEFCWATEADLENAVAVLLTGFLNNHFVADPKPLIIVDGNQPEVGKTLFCQVVGQLLDGHEPERIPLVRDEELEKKVGAKLRESKSSILFFDNLKSKIDSGFVEANALSPLLSVRLLGHSRNINRPNIYLWMVTSNLTTGSTDSFSRALPMCLRYEGNPTERTFKEDLLTYVGQHRLEILGELAGMVEKWKLAGMPEARAIWPAGRTLPRHRCQRWVQIIGGILAINGFTNFLANIEEARATMDEGMLALGTLAECIVNNQMGDGFVNPWADDPDRGKLPREWVQVFRGAEVFKDKLSDKNTKGQETWIGTFLSGKTDRTVTINTNNGTAKAVLRRNPVRNDQKRYYFEISWAPPAPMSPPPALTSSPAESPGSDVLDNLVENTTTSGVSTQVAGNASVPAAPQHQEAKLPDAGGTAPLEWL